MPTTTEPSQDRQGGWNDEQRNTLKQMWFAGYSVDAIGEAIGKTPGGIKAQRARLGLPVRSPGGGLKTPSEFGYSRLVLAPPINDASRAMSPENDNQAAVWAAVRFEDDPRAARRDIKHRGVPDSNRSLTGCAAAMSVAS